MARGFRFAGACAKGSSVSIYRGAGDTFNAGFFLPRLTVRADEQGIGAREALARGAGGEPSPSAARGRQSHVARSGTANPTAP